MSAGSKFADDFAIALRRALAALAVGIVMIGLGAYLIGWHFGHKKACEIPSTCGKAP